MLFFLFLYEKFLAYGNLEAPRLRQQSYFPADPSIFRLKF